MDKGKENLKNRIDTFIRECSKVLNQAGQDPNKIERQTLEKLAESIWELRHFALELLEQHPDESTWYNASIIKEFIDDPIEIEGHQGKISFIRAADMTKRENNDKMLRLLLHSWLLQRELKEVLFSNLRQIAYELAA